MRCLIDPFRIGQVFRNLFENSLAARHESVEVEVEVHCGSTAIDGAPGLRVAVRDNGPGLGPEQRQRIFEPFYTTKPRGTGLGMAIGKRIVDAHGGRIAVADGRNPGEEILIILPRGEP